MAQLTKPLTSDGMPFNVLTRDGDHDAVKIRLGIVATIGDPVPVDHKLGRVPTEVVIVRKDKIISHYETLADKQKVVLVFDATDADITLRIA
jgi:hypothetical protein